MTRQIVTMHDIQTNEEIMEEADLSTERAGHQDRWFATGGVIGAIVASTCCIIPLLLVALGISGAWIANLTALEPYSFYFTVAALAFVGLGFWRVYFRRSRECADDSWCARPRSTRITKFLLWTAALLILANWTMGWWAPLFY